MNKKDYKGYELIKAIYDGVIKDYIKTFYYKNLKGEQKWKKKTKMN